MSAEAKNLQAICAALDQHNDSCPYVALRVRMCPFEVDRLGWDEVKGVPVVADPELGSGRFVVDCSDLSSDTSHSTAQKPLAVPG